MTLLIQYPSHKMQNQLEKYRSIPVLPQKEFIDPIPLMYAGHKEYVINVVELILEHVWQQARFRRTSAAEALMYSGWICRLITLDKRVLNPDEQSKITGWPMIRDFLLQCLRECGNR